MTNKERARELVGSRPLFCEKCMTVFGRDLKHDCGGRAVIWELVTLPEITAALDAATARERKRCARIARKQVPPPALEDPTIENNQCQAHGFNIAAAIKEEP